MTSVLTEAVARLLLAPILVVSVAVLVKGYADVGDGFAAGVIAALGILLQYLVFGRAQAERMLPIRLVPAGAFVGLIGALAVAFWPVLRGDELLAHLPAAGTSATHLGTLELTTAVLFDLAVFLLVLGAVVGIIHALAQAAEGDEP